MSVLVETPINAPTTAPLPDESSHVRQGIYDAPKGVHQVNSAAKGGPNVDKIPFAPRHIRVVCIGAGCSGLFLAICQEQELQNCEFVIYEKNKTVSGTWYENKYPGAACDVPAPIYTYTFEPNPNWTKYYAESDEIQTYFEGVADKYQLRKYIKFEHRVVSAIWSEAKGKWDLLIQHNGKTIADECDVLLNCGGVLNAWKWPLIRGLEKFKGKLLHSAHFDRSFDYSDKRVALVGCGSSGVQCLPGLQDKAAHVDAYFRSAFWVSDPLLGRVAEHFGWNTRNPQYTFTEEEKAKFAQDPTYYLKIRREIEHDMNMYVDMCSPNTPSQLYIRAQATTKMRNALKDKPEILDKIMPKNFDIGCRRLTPGPGFLEALAADNVSFVPQNIAEIKEASIVTVDGKERPVDAIVCATGFDNSWAPRFHLEGRNGYICGKEFAETPRAYFSMSLANLPNYFLMFGPNCCGANGSAVPVIEQCGEYMIKFIKKLQTQDVKSFVVKEEILEEFVAQKDALMPKTVFTQPCSSWYKQGKPDGPVTGTWPGSTLHFLDVIREPRWEDYEWEYLNTTRFSYFGDGLSETEHAGRHRSQYLVDRLNKYDSVKAKYGVPSIKVADTDLLKM
ncbi:FAD/NAD(P)-binding domain-containing protein [Calocera viscosa TUFC12733]|uniref:FAD/NAD(P)-binding domain-containing protein n=1 Tax=Calocera viscosa (strain TUFC12733) TaxID=1330018 RepID=A0A167HBW4_CALVF|nr:FAD/NAD(P)-binding domain-containing protein [Calocera viscosa TUFC12733]